MGNNEGVGYQIHNRIWTLDPENVGLACYQEVQTHFKTDVIDMTEYCTAFFIPSQPNKPRGIK
jgi:hypothetical protein